MKYKATMRIRRKPGEILEVDWAGTTLAVIDPDTGEDRKVYIFIATLPCSQLFYVEGSDRMDLPSWIRLHQHAFEFFGGTPQILVPDNLKTGVTKHTSNELVLNKTYAEMAEHYNTVIMPARVRSPKDKASVEGSVNIVTTWVIQALRNMKFFSIEELNREVSKKLDELNNRPFQKIERDQDGQRFWKKKNSHFLLFPPHLTDYLSGVPLRYGQIIISLLTACFTLFLTN